ncbi:MAG: hypothetical protein BWY92_00263 [Firmicutes bacterium ADurb.BinA052]|nr:MAG: hypothetical protein BWY92_00263 [Firmicutes bacterium ADurb.BinA052]
MLNGLRFPGFAPSGEAEGSRRFGKREGSWLPAAEQGWATNTIDVARMKPNSISRFLAECIVALLCG